MPVSGGSRADPYMKSSSSRTTLRQCELEESLTTFRPNVAFADTLAIY
ncbi:hypothetical protein ACVWXO_001039 [Bradyrhizobium sp. LM2.7]